MAAKKSTPSSRAKSRVASRAKGAARASASKTSAKQDRAAASRAYSKPGKVAEQGAGWGNIARAAASMAGKAKPSAKSTPRKSTDPYANWKSNDRLRSDQKYVKSGTAQRNADREAGRQAQAYKSSQYRPKSRPRSRPPKP